MTDEDPEPVEATFVQSAEARATVLENRWEDVRKVRQEFATELDRMASELPGEGRQQLRSLSRWFKGPAKFADATRRPDVLSLCLPLVESDQDLVSSTSLAQAARRGFCNVGHYKAVNRHLFQVLFYPIVVLFVAALLWIGFSFWIAPEFQKMFLEFGIELPAMTKLILGLAEWVRAGWWLTGIIPIGIALFWILNRIGSDHRPGNLSWLDQRWMSTRNALASWAWHVSLLLQAGFSQKEAIETAGSATANARLRRISFEVTGSRQLDSLGQTESFLFDPKYDLLDCAMRMPMSAGKIALLQEVATYYWDRSRNIGDWWVRWLVAAMLWLILGAIVITVLSLFAPMIAIFSGLSGTK
jgi:type II secretory pathway component PulF